MDIKTVAEAEARQAVIPPHPDTKRLSELLAWVSAEDPDHKGKSEIELFFAAYGDRTNAESRHRTALVTGEDACVRAFCIARQTRMASAMRTSTPAT